MLEQSHPKCLDAGIEIAIKNDTYSGVCEDIKTKRLDSVSISSVDSVEEEDYSWTDSETMFAMARFTADRNNTNFFRRGIVILNQL